MESWQDWAAIAVVALTLLVFILATIRKRGGGCRGGDCGSGKCG